MSDADNAIERRPITPARDRGAREQALRHGRTASRLLGPGVALGALGILGFSFSLPATRLAVADLDPWFIAFGRATVAAVLAAVYLRATRSPLPTRAQARSLVIAAAGVVVGFPLFTSLALQTQTAAHGAVVIAFLPAATAVAAVLRAIGYAEGGALSRSLGAARTICWALVLSAPVTATVAAIAAATSGLHAGTTAWLGFAYVSVISMFLGFFAWYAGLARGGVARVGQVQLAQPVLTLCWSALLLGESVSALTVLTALLVLASVAATQRAR